MYMNPIYEDMFKIMISKKKNDLHDLKYMYLCCESSGFTFLYSDLLPEARQYLQTVKIEKKMSLPKYRFAFLCEIDAA